MAETITHTVWFPCCEDYLKVPCAGGYSCRVGSGVVACPRCGARWETDGDEDAEGGWYFWCEGRAE